MGAAQSAPPCCYDAGRLGPRRSEPLAFTVGHTSSSEVLPRLLDVHLAWPYRSVESGSMSNQGVQTLGPLPTAVSDSRPLTTPEEDLHPLCGTEGDGAPPGGGGGRQSTIDGSSSSNSSCDDGAAGAHFSGSDSGALLSGTQKLHAVMFLCGT
jgi:hypothetical protein